MRILGVGTNKLACVLRSGVMISLVLLAATAAAPPRAGATCDPPAVVSSPAFVSPSPELLERLSSSAGLRGPAAATRAYENALAQARRFEAKGIDRASSQPSASSGTVRALVVPVSFTDQPGTQTVADIQTRFFSRGVLTPGSVADYYAAASLGRMTFTGDVQAWVSVPNDHAYYTSGGDNGGGTYPNNSQKLVEDVVSALTARGVDFGPYDPNGDGQIDFLFIVHSGAGAEQTGESSDDIWSHKWELGGPLATSGGKSVVTYVVTPELRDDGQAATIGVICHEGAHLMGLPDLYRTTEGNKGVVVGDWSLMDSGSWLGADGAGSSPAMPDPFSRGLLGWSNVEEISADTAGVNFSPSYTTGRVGRLRGATQSPTEYFLVENRQLLGFDSALPSGGMLIWHVDTSRRDNNDSAWKMVALEQADGADDLKVPSKSTVMKAAIAGGSAVSGSGDAPSGPGGQRPEQEQRSRAFYRSALVLGPAIVALLLIGLTLWARPRFFAGRAGRGALAAGFLILLCLGCVAGPSGDSGDPFPGSETNRRFAFETNPSSQGNDGTPSGVTIENISDSAEVMTADLVVGRQTPTTDPPIISVAPQSRYVRSSGVMFTVTLSDGEAPSTMTVLEDGALKWSGSFARSVSLQLDDGVHQLTFTVKSPSGATGTAVAEVTVDRSKPVVTMSTISGRRGRSMSVRYRVDDPFSPSVGVVATMYNSRGQRLSRTTRKGVSTQTSSYLTVKAPAKSGKYQVVLTVVDLAGNSGSGRTWAKVK